VREPARPPINCHAAFFTVSIRTAAAETHHLIGADATRLRHQLRHGLRRHMLRRAAEYSRQRIARRTFDLVQQFRLAERLARHDQRTLGSAARQFASECLDFADAEDNRLEPREVVFASGLVHLIRSLLTGHA